MHAHGDIGQGGSLIRPAPKQGGRACQAHPLTSTWMIAANSVSSGRF